MTEIDFYVLADADPRRRDLLICRLTEKAWTLGHRVYIHSPQRAAQLDALLWTFRDDAFLPHALSDHDAFAPIVIGDGDEPLDTRYLLLNLSDSVPSFFSRFERVAEIVNDEPSVREAGRERFRFYRDRGYSLRTHKL